MRKLAIFGNGLGMAIAPNAYELRAAMSQVWFEDILSDNHRDLIRTCLPEGKTRPSSENELARLQDTVAACETLLDLPAAGINHWLTDCGQQFPAAVQRFAFEVSRKIFNATYDAGDLVGDPCRIPTSFANPLTNFVEDSQSHIATLNYDALLSSTLSDAGLLSEQDGLLRDGFIDGLFTRSNLFRPSERGGWYMHLHGSPLFRGKGKNRFTKLAPSTLRKDTRNLLNVGAHIVLTHASQKSRVIAASEILDTYWEFLRLALDEAREVILFGYSGNDIHLNQMIAQRAAEKPIRVVEWLGAGKAEIREPFWRGQLGGQNVELVQKEHVLNFADW